MYVMYLLELYGVSNHVWAFQEHFAKQQTT